MLPRTNASLHQTPLYARRKPPVRSGVVPLKEARSSSLGWEARAKAQRIVTSFSSVRVGAAVPPKSGCVRYWKACGMLQCMSPLVALHVISPVRRTSVAFGAEADIRRQARLAGSVENDPYATSVS